MVGLYEGVAGLRPLLRRGVGKTYRSRRVGGKVTQALSERSDLESAGTLESRRGACREANASLLRVDGRRVRVGTRPERRAGPVMGADRANASPGLAVADKAPSSRFTARTVEHAMASPCLGGYDRREPTLRRQAHSVSPRYPMPGSISKLRTVTRQTGVFFGVTGAKELGFGPVAQLTFSQSSDPFNLILGEGRNDIGDVRGWAIRLTFRTFRHCGILLST